MFALTCRTQKHVLESSNPHATPPEPPRHRANGRTERRPDSPKAHLLVRGLVRLVEEDRLLVHELQGPWEAIRTWWNEWN